MQHVMVSLQLNDVTEKIRDEIYAQLGEKGWNKIHTAKRDLHNTWHMNSVSNVPEQIYYEILIDLDSTQAKSRYEFAFLSSDIKPISFPPPLAEGKRKPYESVF